MVFRLFGVFIVLTEFSPVLYEALVLKILPFLEMRHIIYYVLCPFLIL